ncbi:MAG: hypothetical protein WCL16_11750, partial [bacterium]
NTLTIDGKGVLGGAILTNVSSLRIGYDATVSGLLTANNSVLVTNGGVVYLGAGPHGIGFNNTQLNSTSNNILEIVQGGRVFSTGLIKVGSIGDYSGFHYDNQLVIRDADSVLNLGNSDLIVGWCSTGGNAVFLRRSWVLCDGGLITNVGAVTIGFAGSSMMLADNNRIVVTNGGRFYNRGAIQVGGGFASNNLMTITGTNSLWDMGGYNLTVGAYQLAKSNTANSVFIDQGGTLDNIGTLTVYTNSFANLCGGTLGVANTLYTNGLFIVGDGAQAATLKALAGGTLAFNSGLLITNNATLSGVGTVAGGPTGVLVTNGATIAPGLSGAGTLTIGGSNLTWSAGGTYICEITNLNKAAGIGWDLVNVSSQLVLNGSGLVIKMDSLGAAAANFDATRDYNLRILNYGSQVGFDPANFSINTNAFMGSVVPWTVTNANNSLWLVYRGSGVTYPPSSTWNAPTSGNWNVNGNWTPSGQPANDGSAKLEFGGSGAAYASTNNLGTFLLNQLLLTGSSGASVTNVIGGSTLVFTNSAALVDYSGSATYLITNKLQAATTLVFGGPGYGGTVTIQSNIVATGGLTKQGPWTLELKNLNTFGGTVVVDSPIQDGVLKVANNNGLGAGSAVIVSNGTLWTAMATGDYYFASTASGNNRQGLITGNGSVWNNSAGIFNVGGINATNVSLIVADGGMLSMSSTLTIGRNNASYNSLIVTNGGRLSCSGAVLAISSSADRNTLLVTGSNSVCDLGGSLTISSSGAYNMLLVDQGGLATNCGAIIFGNASAGGQLVVANGGRVYASSLTFMNASGSFAGSLLITGSNSLLQAGGVSKLARFAGRGNRAVVDQRGTITNLSWTLADAGDGISNSVIVATGGRMFCNAQSIICTGSRNTNNTISISGAGSLWDNGGKHLIVANGQTNVWNANTWNGICIAAGGTMTNVATLNLANTNSPGSSSNYVTVTDGTLQADTLTSSNDLPQYLTIDGQSLVTITNALVATNIAVFLNGGMLSAKNMTFNNGAPFIVGGLDTFLIDTDGVAKLTSKVTPQAATLSLLTGGSSVFSNGLVITNLASLTGSGLIVATSTVYGTLSPGAGIGVITNSGDLILKASATTKIEIATNSTAGAGWDLLTVTNGTLNLGGNLNVVLTGGFTPLNAQSFVVM